MCLNGHYKKKIFTVQIVLLCILLLAVCGNVNGAESPSNYSAISPDFGLAAQEKTGTTYQLISFDVPQDRFAVFIPPGTQRITLKAFCRQNSRMAVVTRLGQTPTCDYDTDKEYTLLNWPGSRGADLGFLKSSDHQSRNYGGSIEILNSGASEVDGGGEWVYGKVIKYESGAHLEKSTLTMWITVNDKFKDWYNGGGMDLTPGVTRNNSSGNCSALEAGVPDGDGFVDTPPSNSNPDKGGSVGLPPAKSPVGYTSPPPPTDKAGGNNFTGGDTGGDTGGGGEEEGSSRITDPVVSLPVLLEKGKWVAKECRIADLGNRSKVILTPSVTIEDIENPGLQHCYAGILKDGDFFIAQKDIVGQIVFTHYSEGPIPSYELAELNNSTTVSNVFYELLDQLNYSPSGLLDNQVRFYLGFAPEGSDLTREGFRGVEIQITP